MGYLDDMNRDPNSFNPGQTQISDDSLVENRITGLLSQDNPYMRQATTVGNQQAQRRGLLSSSMAVGAAEGARINAALPIAQQDAQLYGNRDLQDGAYNQQSALNSQAYTQQLNLNDQTYDNTYSINDQLFGHNTQLNDQTFNHNTQLNDQTFDHNYQLNDQTFDHNSQLSDQSFHQNTQLADQGFNHQTQLNDQNNGANAQLQMDNQVATLQLNTNNQIATIERDPNLSPEQRSIAINNLISLQNAQINAIRRGETLSPNFIYPSPSGGTQAPGGGAVTPVPTPARPRPTMPFVGNGGGRD